VSDINAPVDPKSTAGYRAAKLAVIVLSALIILALIGLVVGVVLKMTGRSTHLFGPGGGSASDTAFVLPAGARIMSSETQPGRLILHVRSGEGDEIDIVSTDDGRLVARIRSAPPAPPVR
jgi:hypothetical protein